MTAVTRPILRAFRWPTNAHLIADVATLGYIGDSVLDATFGEGVFWKMFRPRVLCTNDRYKHAASSFDFRAFPECWVNLFATVVFDPPYKLNGTPEPGQFDKDRYGVDRPMRWQDRMALITDGAVECYRLVKPGGSLLVKVQDQVCSGAVRWQTRAVEDALETVPTDRFEFIGDARAQPAGRKQVHARANNSQLLVFRKPKKKGK